MKPWHKLNLQLAERQQVNRIDNVYRRSTQCTNPYSSGYCWVKSGLNPRHDLNVTVMELEIKTTPYSKPFYESSKTSLT
ncbi:hypothetical protein TNCV_4830591 [Trichonephila clavipes]|nr:hypothetical protein TNCV_4830591 [Trichonephila clavipes]